MVGREFQVLLVLLRAVVAPREGEDQWIVVLELAEPAHRGGVIRQCVVGEGATGSDVGSPGSPAASWREPSAPPPPRPALRAAATPRRPRAARRPSSRAPRTRPTARPSTKRWRSRSPDRAPPRHRPPPSRPSAAAPPETSPPTFRATATRSPSPSPTAPPSRSTSTPRSTSTTTAAPAAERAVGGASADWPHPLGPDSRSPRDRYVGGAPCVAGRHAV